MSQCPRDLCATGLRHLAVEIWKYDYLNHLSLAHSEHAIAEAEVAEYAVSSVEFRAVVKKSKFWHGSVQPEAHIGQFGVPQRSRLWSILVPDSVCVDADVEMGAAEQADAAGQSRPGPASASGDLVEKRQRVVGLGGMGG